MKHYFALLIGAVAILSYGADAASYSTEATITPLPDSGQYRVDVRVSRLVQQDGRTVEELVAKPRLLSVMGCRASLHQGLNSANPGYQNEDNVSVDVSWPYPDESGVAYCTIVVRHGDQVASRSKLQLQVRGKGRVPLVLTPQDVDPKSVQVETDKSRDTAFVLLEFRGKTRKEARAMAVENLGNHVKIQDAAGRVVGSGMISGTYKDIGLALRYNSEAEARRVAGALEGTPGR
jgi:hypothetical protein